MNYPRLLLAAVAAVVVFFAWGFLTEGWLLRKDFAPSGRALSNLGAVNEVHALWVGVPCWWRC